MQRFCNVAPGRVARPLDQSDNGPEYDRQPFGQYRPLDSNDLEKPTMTHEHDHDTVVVDDRSGSGMGAVLGIVAIIVLLAAVWFFALGPGAGSTTNNNNTTNNNGGAAPTEPAAPAGS
jgi:hypothetical protein